MADPNPERTSPGSEPGPLVALVIADMDDRLWRGPSGKAELVISLGDTCDNLILEAAEAFRCATIFALKGNHDTPAPFAEGIIDLHLKRIEFRGLTFAGFNGCWRYKRCGHFLYEQAEAEAALRGLPAVDVFLSHNSPRGVHERGTDFHRGFEALNGYIERARPAHLLHGHQHVNDRTRVGETVVRGVYGAELVELCRG